MEVGVEIGTTSLLGNEGLENRSGRLLLTKAEDIVSPNGNIGLICVDQV